jgi:hypothetical protein
MVRGITHDMIFKIDQGQFFVGHPVEVWNELGNCLMSGLGKQLFIIINTSFAATMVRWC